MRRPVVFIAFLLLAFGLSTVTASAQNKDEWRELRTPHFHLVSNAGTETTKKFGRRLERYRQVMGLLFPGWAVDPPPRSHVFLFRDRKSFRPYSVLTDKQQPAPVSGFLTSRGEDRLHLALNLGSANPEGSLVHEYTHLVTSRNFGDLPLWLVEGLAGLLEDSVAGQQQLRIGPIQPASWERLKTTKLLPVERLVHLQRWQDFIKDGAETLLHVQSQLLVHYLFVAGEGKYRTSFLLFLRLLQEGTGQDRAFARTFRLRWEDLDRELQEYLRRLAPEEMTASLPLPPVYDFPEPAPLPVSRREAYLAELWLTQGRTEEAEAALHRLTETQEADADVYYLLGRIALDRSQERQAERHFRAGLALEPESKHLRYFAAQSFFRGRIGDLAGTEEMRAAMDEMVELLTPLTEKPGEFPEAYRLLVHARLNRGDPPSELIPLVEEARRVLATGPEFDLTLGHLYVREERWQEARKVFDRLLARSTDKTEQADARNWLRFLEIIRRPTGGLDFPEPDGEEDGEEEERTEIDAEARNTKVLTGEIVYVRGILAGVECGEEGSVLVLHVGDGNGQPRVLRLLFSSLEVPLVFDRTASGQGIECHTAGISVGINYRAAATRDTTVVAGTVLTLEPFPFRH